MRMIKFISLTAILGCCACSSVNGNLETHDVFKFPNSDVTDVNNGQVHAEESVTVMVWDEVPLSDIRRRLIAKAIASVPSEEGKKDGKGIILGPMLVNEKWITTTTVFPFVPVISYKVSLDAKVTKAELFIKRDAGS